MDKVFIRGLEVEAVIGVFDWEKQVRQPLIFDLAQSVILRRGFKGLQIFRRLNFFQNWRQIKVFCFPAIFLILSLEQVYAPLHFINAPHAKLRHVLPQLFSHKVEVVHHMLRLPLEPPAQLRILGCDTHRAGVQMAFAHHDAAHCNERHCCKAKLLRAQ